MRTSDAGAPGDVLSRVRRPSSAASASTAVAVPEPDHRRGAGPGAVVADVLEGAPYGDFEGDGRIAAVAGDVGEILRAVHAEAPRDDPPRLHGLAVHECDAGPGLHGAAAAGEPFAAGGARHRPSPRSSATPRTARASGVAGAGVGGSAFMAYVRPNPGRCRRAAGSGFPRAMRRDRRVRNSGIPCATA